MQRLIKNLLAPKKLILLASLYSLFILVMSLARLNNLPKLNFNYADKVLHLGAYLFLNFLWLLASLKKESKNQEIKKLIFISLAVIAFGIVIELLQYTLTNYRTLDFYDAMANTLGVIIALVVILLLRTRLRALILNN